MSEKPEVPTMTSKNLPSSKPPVIDPLPDGKLPPLPKPPVTDPALAASIPVPARDFHSVESSSSESSSSSSSNGGVAVEEVPYNYDEIEARPLADPGWANIKTKNPRLSFRYVYYAHSERARTRFEECSAMGFRIAKDTDCEVPGVVYRDGCFRRGDTILMCIDKARYEGAIKYKDELSLHLAGRRKRSNQARPARRDPRTGEAIVQGTRGKITFFEPNKEELDQFETPYTDAPQRRSDVLTETVRKMTRGDV